MRQKDDIVWIWQAVCQCPATLPRCSRPCFLAAENTIKQSDLCTARHTAKTKYVLYVRWIVARCIIFQLRSKCVQNARGEANKKLDGNVILRILLFAGIFKDKSFK